MVTDNEKTLDSLTIEDLICVAEPESPAVKHYSMGCWGADGGFC